jgi:SAM-dependent methyltransferase
VSKIPSMGTPPSEERPAFDDYAQPYDRCLNQALSATGEDKDFYAAARVRWTAKCLCALGVNPSSVMDFGCGTGTTAPLLLSELKCGTVIGVDTSSKMIERARQTQSSPQIQFAQLQDFCPHADLDCAYCNGVLHHIPAPERLRPLALVREALRPGGIFALWENNPWNPGTRYVMSRCAFDEDAVKISAAAARRMLRQAGFGVLQTDFLFFFPRPLAALRPLERLLHKVPLGGQYQVLCRKPIARRSTG